ncbi:MAG: exo-alpha-sialidase [Microbacterium sp.]|nr:exo-alpha-sialidase [Microbacterium sp.]
MTPAQVISPADTAHPRHSEGSVLRLDDGSLMLAWSAFSSSDTPPGTRTEDPTAREWAQSRDNNPAEIRTRVSDDEGLTWRSERTLIPNDAAINVMQPALVRLPDGGIGLTYSERQSRHCARRLFRRSDDGTRWSAAVDVTGIDGYVTASNDRVIVLDSGRIIQPVHQLFDRRIATRVAWSDDLGRTWRHSALLEVPTPVDGALYGLWEAGVAQRVDGSLLLAGRTAVGSVHIAESVDGGETWTPPTATAVVAPASPPLVRPLGVGRLVLLHNSGFEPGAAMQGPRSRLVASVSDDAGATWSEAVVVEDRPDRWYHYPSCLIEGERAYVTYSVTDPETRLWTLAGRWIGLP